MDLAMSVLDGATATRKIKKLDNCSSTPVVAVTAYNHRRSEALKAGCVEVLDKPIQLLQLKHIIDNLLLN
jgi:CheY-like chemotaxis protein